MDPETLLRRLCRAHGVPPARGRRLYPLICWALESPPEVRERILAIVEETLAWRGEEGDGERPPEPTASPAVLIAVARVLHEWSPSERILGIGSEGGGPSPA